MNTHTPSLLRINFALIFIVLLLTYMVSSVFAQTGTIGVASKLYSNGHPTNNRQGDIHGMASLENYLYVSWHYLTDPEGNLTDEIHIWNISNPASPQLLQINSFQGSLGGFQETLNTPRSLQVIKGHLVFWSANKLYVNKINQDGTYSEVLNNGFVDDLNPDGTGDLAFGGVFASTQRTMLSNNEFLQSGDENRLQDYAYLNLQDPTQPYFETLGRDVGKDLLYSNDPVNGVFQGLPATIALSGDQTNIALTTFHHTRSAHFDKFWKSALRDILQRKNLNKSLSTLTSNMVTKVKPSKLNVSLFTQFAKTLNLGPDYGLQNLVQAQFADAQMLGDALTELGIDRSDSVQLAIEKLVEKAVRSNFSGQAERILGNQLLLAFHDTILGPKSGSVRTKKRALTAFFNRALTKQGVEGYLVKAVLSPLLGNPPLLNLRLKDIIRQVSNSPLGAVVDGGLTAFHEAFPIEAIQNGLPFDTPKCFRIPRTSSALLKKLVVDTGAELNIKGIALFEMLKLVDFYTGEGNYRKLAANLRTGLKDLHETLGNEFVTVLLSEINQFATEGLKLSSAFNAAAQTIQFEKALSIPLAKAIGVSLSAAGISINQSVGTTLNSLGLYTSVFDLPAGASLATIGSLRQKITDLGLDSLRLDTVIRATGRTASQDLSTLLDAVAKQLTNKVFGEMNESTTLEQALQQLVVGRISGKVYGRIVQTAIGGSLTNLDQDISFPNVFGSISLAAKGDCLAQWQLALTAAQTAAAGSVVFAEFAPIFGLANTSLTTAYETAIEYVVKTLLQQFLTEIFSESVQSYESWFSRPEAQEFIIPVQQILSAPAQNVTPFISRGKVAVIATDVEPFGSFPANPEVNLILFQPDAIAASRQVVSLGSWYSLNNIEQRGDYLLLQGQKIIDDFPTSSSILVNLNAKTVSPQTIGGQAAEDIANAENMTLLRGNQILAVSNLGGQVILLQSGSGA